MLTAITLAVFALILAALAKLGAQSLRAEHREAAAVAHGHAAHRLMFDPFDPID